MRKRKIIGQTGNVPVIRTIASENEKKRHQKYESNSYSVPSGLAFQILLIARLTSAAYNIIHDCDEVFNYWEPLHYLIYKYGLQTWEYSAEFALRSWWYLLLHAGVGGPIALIAGSQHGKLAVFYAIRVGLAIISTCTEIWLYDAVKKRYNTRISTLFLCFLVFSSGMFCASAALLPSSFTMYAVTSAAAGVLSNSSSLTIFSAVIGVVWGWCVAGIAFVPYAVWVVFNTNLVKSFRLLFLALFTTLAPLVLTDRVFYGNWKASLWNFLMYNVAGGGKSALYGVENSTYYLRNGFTQLQFTLPLSLVLPILSIVVSLVRNQFSRSHGPRSSSKGVDFKFITAVSPLYLWLAAITALPHKEERFQYVVYPLICLAAAGSVDAAVRIVSKFGIRALTVLAKTGMVFLVIASTLLGISRSWSLVSNYNAPFKVYRSLPTTNTSSPTIVCVGAEWHRFPSSFFLPGPNYRLQFIKSGFTGLLPRAFDPGAGGTRAAPPELNDQNRQEPSNYWTSAARCNYAVTLETASTTTTTDDGHNGHQPQWLDGGVLGKKSKWTVVKEHMFLDATHSPALTRAFYIPYISSKKNKYMKYLLLSNNRVK